MVEAPWVRLPKGATDLKKSPIKQEVEKIGCSLDRREFVTAGLALAAAAMLPPVAFGAPPKKQLAALPRRKLGVLDVSALGLGCMSMNGGQYNPPRGERKMIGLVP